MKEIPSAEEEKPTPQQRRWAIIRLVVGLGQVIGGICAIVLFVQAGMNRLTLAVIYGTSLLSLASLVLFRFRATETRQSCAKKVVAEFLWIYLTAPMLGACLAVLACRCVQDQGCCCAAPKPSHSGGPL